MAFRYKLHDEDGSDIGEAVYAAVINPGEIILTGPGRRWRVLELNPAGGRGRLAVQRPTESQVGLRESSGLVSRLRRVSRIVGNPIHVTLAAVPTATHPSLRTTGRSRVILGPALAAVAADLAADPDRVRQLSLEEQARLLIDVTNAIHELEHLVRETLVHQISPAILGPVLFAYAALLLLAMTLNDLRRN